MHDGTQHTGTRRALWGRRTWSLAAAVLGLLAPMSTTWPPADLGPNATIQDLRIGPAVVSGTGGMIEITADVSYGASCHLVLLSSQSFHVSYTKAPTPCATQQAPEYSASAQVAPNKGPLAELRFELVVTGYKNAQGASQETAVKVEPYMAPGPTAPQTSIALNAPTPTNAGGKISFTVHSHNASHCSVMEVPPTWAGAADMPIACDESIAAPLGPGYGGVTIYITALASSPQGQTVATTVHIDIPMSISQPGQEVQPGHAWAGYSMAGGPYRSIKGTFTVPNVAPWTPTKPTPWPVDVWMGIDGTGQSDFIQAGVEVESAGCGPQQQTATGPVAVCPWIYYIQDNQAQWGPKPALTILPGDSISESITIGPGTETVVMTDNTTAKTWSDTMSWYGQGTSAEWVVEAPGDHEGACGQPKGSCPLAPFSPAVQFSGLGVTLAPGGRTHFMGRLVLLCGNGSVCAEPQTESFSQVLADGFTVAYSGPGRTAITQQYQQAPAS